MLSPFKRQRQAERVEPPVVEVESTIPKIARSTRSPQRARRSFDAGENSRLTSGWTTTPLTADQVIDRNLRPLVARSREEAANNDYMKSFLRLCRQNVVGSRGVVLQAQARDENGTLDRGANEALEIWWKKWCRAENSDIRGRRSFRLQLQNAVNTAAKDGEFMFREIRGKAAGPMGYALQSLDPQRCPVDYNVERLNGGRFVRQGIEYTREGRPVAFYFMRGDMAHTGYTFGGRSLDRVAAGEIIHGFRDDIEGQRRGLPWAATSLWRLHMLGGFEKAALTNARIGASSSGFLEWADGEGPDVDEALDDEEVFLEAEGGTFQELPPGLRMKEFKPQYPAGEFAPFRKAMLQGAGAGMGVAYVSFANDLEGVNFSSIRQGVLDEREHWMDLQEWLIETLVDRAYRGALEMGLLLGVVKGNGITLRPERREKYEAVLWQPRRWPWVDPTKDVNAEILSKNNLLTAPSDIIRRRGQDPDAVWRQTAADLESMRDAGLPDEFIFATLAPSAQGISAPSKAKKTEDSDDEDE